MLPSSVLAGLPSSRPAATVARPGATGRKPAPRIGRGGSTQPKADRSKLDEGEVIGGEFVIAGGDTPALFDFVEEPLQLRAR
jgi:hypothetical protein